ncbi:MAG: hypothetical protein ABUL63_05605, partial [Acidobacteriota bacterium]
MIGSVVSHYRVVERLGGGGAALYKAQDLNQERMVALHLLPGTPGSTGMNAEAAEPAETARERFAREGARASSIGDPHIGHVYEVGETDEGQVFLAMALDEG